MSARPKIMTLPVIVQVFVFVILVPFLPMLISWHWDWWEGWYYALLGILGFIVSRVLAAKKHPDLIAERAKFTRHEDIQPWDKVLARLLGLGSALVPLTAGLDMRYGWSMLKLGLGWKLAAIVLMTAGFALGAWALVENRFFSGVVRIQKERGHHVVSSGPYAWVRHPGYAGALLTYLLSPLLLDSLWTFVPAGLLTILLIVRTALEDQALQAELPGYQAYTRKTRYRLLPGIW